MTGSTSRLQAVLGIATVVLLVVIGVLIVFVPRFNYSVLSSRIAGLEASAAALESRVEKLNVIGGPGEERRAAVVGNIEFVASDLKRLDTDLVSFLDHLATTKEAVESVSRRLSVLEELWGRKPALIESESISELASPENARFRADLESKASELSPGMLSQMGFDHFASFAVESGVIAASYASPENIDARAQLRSLFTLFQSCIETINRRETLYVRELVERATLDGNYVEEEVADAKVMPPPRPGTRLFVKNLGNGRRRLFQFSMTNDQEIAHFNALRDGALKSFLVLLAVLEES
jgi:hypothetical protein